MAKIPVQPRLPSTGHDRIDRGLVDVVIEFDHRIGLALYQSNLPVIKRMSVTNPGDRELCALVATCWIEPEVAPPTTMTIERIDPQRTLNFTEVDLPLCADRLKAAVTRTPGQLWIEIATAEWGSRSHQAVHPGLPRSEDRVLYRRDLPIEILARHEWGGLSSLPELLVAFVDPSQSAVDEILDRGLLPLGVSELEEQRKGYQGKDPSRVLPLAEAVWKAIEQARIVELPSAPQFVHQGQVILTPAEILAARQATRLDAVLLAVACLERAGLNPLVLLGEDRVFAGAWLRAESLPQPVSEDGRSLVERVDQGDLTVFDLALADAPSPVSFAESAHQARSRLEDSRRFLCAIDVKASRDRGIEPLGAGEPQTSQEQRPKPGRRKASSATGRRPSMRPPKPEPVGIQLSRLERWKLKLLDLSLRNRLLNFRESARSIRLMCPDLASLEDALAAGNHFQILALPAEMNGESRLAPAGPATASMAEETDSAFLLERMRAGTLFCDLPESRLKSHLVGMFRAARSSIEESGANTLHLALGTLAWTETAGSKVRRFAPLVLLPAALTRASVREPFRVQLSDEEARVNVTLLEKLKKEYGIHINGLDVLPQDAEGLDMPAIFEAFRKAVEPIPGWAIEEQAHLGLFTFTKHLMWVDLEQRTEDLEKNAVVRGLIQGSIDPKTLPAPVEIPKALDEVLDPSRSFCVLDADSTQLAAILAAEKGMNYALEGPPGTGKSQTIANIIAHCLATGKTVLFVSQKLAALNVVYNRLAKVGLAPFCLELHSDKSRKSDIVRQINDALQLDPQTPPDQWEEHCQALVEVRSRLNGYVQTIHRRRPAGFSFFDGTSRLIGLGDWPKVPLSFDHPDEFNPKRLDQMRQVIASLTAAARETGPPAKHPWRAIRRCEWNSAFGSEVLETLKALLWAADNLERSARQSSEALEIPCSRPSRAELVAMAELADGLLSHPAPPPTLVDSASWRPQQPQIEYLLKLGRQRDELWDRLKDRYTDLLLSLDLDRLHERFSRWSTAFFLIAFFLLFTARRQIKQAFTERHLSSNPSINGDLEVALDVREKNRTIASVGFPLAGLLGTTYQGEDTDWDLLERTLTWSSRFKKVLGVLLEKHAGLAPRVQAKLGNLVTEQASRLAREGDLNPALSALKTAFAGYEQARIRLVELLMLKESQAWGSDEEPDYLARVRTQIGEWEANTFQLRNWCGYARALKAADELGLTPLAQAHARGKIEDAKLPQAFEHSFLTWWVGQVMAKEPILNGFYGPEHNHQIERFRSLDSTSIDLARCLVRAKLAEKIPRPADDVAERSELGILLREIKKKRRHQPLRQLFGNIPNLLRIVKPCLLMSPLSVAQYLDPSLKPFDLVVFDEASQIPPWDAVGAVARGNQVIVVGDPKQLPPTSFFMKEDTEEALDESNIEEMESILDECLVSGLPTRRLGLHYRSRHESLISFSNYHYYENRLITFPCAQVATGDLGVSWRHIAGGIYERGGSRTNRLEAEAVAAEIVARLTDPAQSARSIGVVTFSLAQQKLIEDLLDEARGHHPEIEPFFTDDVDEPVFVKNLENVQGDERDVMLFSICYGPDQEGRSPMNFGPLNRDGGERRLNVAVTRAREQLVVFSTLRPEQIDLGRTNSVGAVQLKSFLEYAQRGVNALSEVVAATPPSEQQASFEESVRQVLTQREWLVDSQVGHSSQRIDLAVRDPERPERYLMGIELDGPFYNALANARDRDRIRPQILKGLTWNLHRIWSIDWLQNQRGEIERLNRALDRARASLIESEAASRLVAQTPGAEPSSPITDIETEEPTPAAAQSARGTEARLSPSLEHPAWPSLAPALKPAAIPGASDKNAAVPGASDKNAAIPGTSGKTASILGASEKTASTLGTSGKTASTLGTSEKTASILGASEKTAAIPGVSLETAASSDASGKPAREPSAANRSAPAAVATEGPLPMATATDKAPVKPSASKKTRVKPAPTVQAPPRLPFNPRMQPYRYAAQGPRLGTADDFFGPSANLDIVRVVEAVLAEEAPISIGEVTRRVGTCWDIGQARKRVVQRILDAIALCPPEVRPTEREGFLWRPDQDPLAYPLFRPPAANDSRHRRAEDICPEEIANAALYVVKQSIAIPEEDLAKETARQLGIVRMGQNVREQMMAGIALLKEQALCLEESGMILLPLN